MLNNFEMYISSTIQKTEMVTLQLIILKGP